MFDTLAAIAAAVAEMATALRFVQKLKKLGYEVEMPVAAK